MDHQVYVVKEPFVEMYQEVIIVIVHQVLLVTPSGIVKVGVMLGLHFFVFGGK